MRKPRLHGMLAALVVALATTVGPMAAQPAAAQCGDRDCRVERKPVDIPGGMGWVGAGSGSRTAVPGTGGGGSWPTSPSYGTPAAGLPKVAARTMSAIERLARRYGVPWPKEGTIRARDMRPYGVYQIYYEAPRGGSRAHKYGITRVGDTRPRSQLGPCRKAVGVRCRYIWLRRDVGGWKHARQVEAGYAAKYKHKFGDCPPGMRRCL